MQSSKRPVNRTLVGFLTLVLLGFACLLSIWPGLFPGAAGLMVAGTTARVGVVLAALWLALPAGNRPAAWANLTLTSASPLVLASLALLRVPFRILVPLAGALLVVGLFLRPKPLPRPERRVD
jgi:hypothetical protein